MPIEITFGSGDSPYFGGVGENYPFARI